MKFVRNTKYYTGVVYEWNLPAGHTCPFALECRVKVDRETGKFDISKGAFRCYASSAERFPAVREHRWRNFEHVTKGDAPILPKNCENVRIHASGDFYSQAYFDLWSNVCKDNPDVNFWAFTKSIGYWIERLNDIPDNLILTASYGGRDDELIEKHGLKSARVIKDKSEAGSMPIDYNDDEARKPDISFCLLDNNAKKIPNV